MARMTEIHVVRSVKSFYESRYWKMFSPNQVHVYSEKKTKKRIFRKSGRTDILIVIRYGKKHHIVSVEAKSFKTRNSLRVTVNKAQVNASRFIGNIIFFGLSLRLLPSASIWMRVSLALMLAFFLSYTLINILRQNHWYDRIGVIDQVSKYPSNEKWIALSMDMLNRCSSGEKGVLLTLAKRKGIGVLTVSPGNCCKVVQEPHAVGNGIRPNYLSQYMACEVIKRDFESCMRFKSA